MEVVNYKEKPTIELQELDCNCNDCKHLERSLSSRQRHVDFHYRMQKSSFNIKRIKLLERGEFRLRRGEKDKARKLFKEARGMKFISSEGSCSLHYGICHKFNKKKVSFIQGTLQLNTQDCFKHRNNKL